MSWTRFKVTNAYNTTLWKIMSFALRLYRTAAYLFHLAKNHPFIDGNKRTCFATMVALLSINSYSLNLSQDQAYTLVSSSRG